MAFDPTKPVQTRDGRPARIICTDRNTEINVPIIALVTDNSGREGIQCYDSEGHLYGSRESVTDLINVPTVRTGWINIYPDGFTSLLHATEAVAKSFAEQSIRKPVTVKVEWTE